MTFDEIRFPTNLSYGTVGGPGFNSNVIETDGGEVEIVQRWASPLRTYNARYSVKSVSDIGAVLDFYMARGGVSRGFRFKDHSDFTTASDHRSSHSDTDEVIGTGDGVTTTFQLVKTYGDGSNTRTRTIEKPVSGTVRIAVAGVSKTEGVDFTVNTTTGIVTMMSAPALSASVTAGFEFDVPVMFGREIDRQLRIVLAKFDAEDVPDIPIVEIRNVSQTDDDYFYGGSKDLGAISANASIAVADGRLITVDPQSGGLILTLPATASLNGGGPYFVIANLNATNSIIVKDQAATTIVTVAALATATLWLSVDTIGTKIWVAT